MYMKKHIIHFSTFILLFTISSQTVFAQIGQTRADIIEDKGTNYEAGITDDGTKYIVYKKVFTTEPSGTFTRHKVIYFIILDNGKEVCHIWKHLEPASETNTNVAYFKKNMVEIDYMTWKDYETNIIYEIKVDEGLCVTTVSYDFDKQ